MKHASGTAFRRALEDRLLQRSRLENIPLVRLRKAYAFDRLLAHLFTVHPDDWVLKGGYALQIRFAQRARVTKDIDLASVDTADIHNKLTAAATLKLGDWTTFTIAPPSGVADDDHSLRCHVQTEVDSRRFESFNLDIGLRDQMVMPPEDIILPDTLGFADLLPVSVKCYALEQQIAEKFHAFTQIYASGRSTRVKDLVDMVLIAAAGHNLDAEMLQMALRVTFELRHMELPSEVPDAPADWGRPYIALAQEINLTPRTLIEAMQVLRAFLNPILAGQATGVWRAGRWFAS